MATKVSSGSVKKLKLVPLSTSASSKPSESIEPSTPLSFDGWVTQLEDQSTIPEAETVHKVYLQQLHQQEQELQTQAKKRFFTGLRNKETEIEVCDTIEYEWQQEAIHRLFFDLGYEITYQTVSGSPEGVSKALVLVRGAPDFLTRFRP